MNWKTSTIGDVLALIKNGVNCNQNKNGIGNKITRIETIAAQNFDLDRVGYATLTDIEREKNKLKKGDILFSHINSPSHVGKSAIYESDEDLYHGINLLLLRVIDEVNPYFFNYFLNYLFNSGYWEANCKKAVNQASVNQKDISKVVFSYPSIDLQTKIVAKIDALLAKVDDIAMKNKVLIENLESFVSSYMDDIFNTNKYPSKRYALGDVCIFQGGSQPAKSYFEFEPNENNIRFIQIRDYKSDKNIVYIPKKLARRFCDVDDVMIGRYGPPVFQILRGIKGSYNVALMKAVPNEDILKKEFLYYFLKNPVIQNYVISLSSRAAGQSGLNKETIEPFKIDVPSLDDQDKIIKKINLCFFNIEKIKNTSLKNISECMALRRAILHQAFNGELVKD